MRVRDLCQPEVVSVHRHEDISVAASRMEFYEVGSLVVMDHEELVGIITERDVTRAVAEERAPWLLTVDEFMTEQPVTVSLDTDVMRATALMLDIGARHLPVVEAGRVVAMVSARDLLSRGVLAHVDEVA